MEEREKLEQDKKPINYTKIAAALLIVLSVSLLALWHVESNPEYYYRAYLLEDQYIGDIEGWEGQVDDCLIMNVSELAVPISSTGDEYVLDLYCDWKYCFNLGLDRHVDPIDNFVFTGKSTHLYFANEDQLKDLEVGTVIVARWKKNPIGRDVIRGVKTFTTDTYFP